MQVAFASHGLASVAHRLNPAGAIDLSWENNSIV